MSPCFVFPCLLRTCPTSPLTRLQPHAPPASSRTSPRPASVHASASYPNPLGVHSLIFTESWTSESAGAAVSFAARCGYDLIEIPVLPGAAAVDVAATRAALDAAGMTAACSLGLSEETDVSSESEECVERGLVFLKGAVDVCEGIGAKHLGGLLYSKLGRYEAPVSEKGRENAVRVVKELAKYAKGKNVTLCLEACNRYETNVINTARGAMDFLDRVGEDNVFAHVDFYHMNIEEQDAEQAIRLCGERLGYVHVGESHRGYLGTGSIDHVRLFRALAAIDYKGPLTFESFSSVMSGSLVSTLAAWGEQWTDSEDLITSARQYMDSQWTAARRLRKQT